MATLALKARHLFWRSKPQKSVPVLDVPTSDDEDSEDESAHQTARKRRRTRVEIHGVTPSRRSTRYDTSADVVPASVPRLASGAPMFQRDDLRDLTAQERLMFVHAVDNAKLQGRTMMEVAAEWGVNKNCYARYKKQLMKEGSLESKHSRAGRPRKLQTSDVAKLTKLNREKLGDLTYKELAQKLKRRIGFAVSATTIWRTAKREGWVDVAW